MRKFYPIIVQIEHLEKNENSILSLQPILEEEKNFEQIFNALKKIELVPNENLVNQILKKGLSKN